jgi:poly(A) polymerase Pap1
MRKNKRLPVITGAFRAILDRHSVTVDSLTLNDRDLYRMAKILNGAEPPTHPLFARLSELTGRPKGELVEDYLREGLQ